jgi:hypothetical protein
MLEATQKGDLDVTEGLEWLLGCLDRAIAGAEETLSSVLRKARFWEANKNQLLNERQRRVIDRLLDGFEGKPPRPNGRRSPSHLPTRRCATVGCGFLEAIAKLSTEYGRCTLVTSLPPR